MTFQDDLREVLEAVAKNGTKGTSDNINERVLIQALSQITKLVEEDKETIGRYIKTFGHIHEAGKENIDTCAKCGLDLRDDIHKRG